MIALPAVILCGGLGTRLRSVVADVPKVLAPIGGVPFLDLLLARLRMQGLCRVVLSTGHLADQVAAHVAGRTYDGLEVTCLAEPSPLGTGGAVRFATSAAGLRGPVLVLNGDTFCDAPLEHLVSLHARTPPARATLALAHVPDTSRFGTVEIGSAEPGAAAPVLTFREKQPGGSGWVNAGVYLLDTTILDDIAVGQVASLEHDVLPHLADHLFAVPFPRAHFLDIGTPEDYRRAEAILLPSAS